MYVNVLHFWFDELKPAQWFEKDGNLDRMIKQRFGDLHRQVAACEHDKWRQRAQGRLAEIIVLDQFSRNIYRNSPKAFENDAVALALAQEAVAGGADGFLSSVQKGFLYMPFMHSESLVIHERAVELFSAPGLEESLDYELRHKAIIERFGRYPHRNALLGRVSTVEEEEFLRQPGSSF